MISEEVKLSVEEWLAVGENTKRLLFKNSPIKVALDKTLINISKVQNEFAKKQQELVDKYAERDAMDLYVTKVPGKDKGDLDNIVFKDEEAFKKELSEILLKEVSVPMYRIEGNLEYPYNGVQITLKKYLEICTDIPAIDCLFLLEYYIK